VDVPRLLNPLERARAAKIRTAAEVVATGKAAKAATELSAAKAGQANKAIAALRGAELAVAKAQTRLDAATKALDAVKTPEPYAVQCASAWVWTCSKSGLARLGRVGGKRDRASKSLVGSVAGAGRGRADRGVRR
jgi:hypothetical protein